MLKLARFAFISQERKIAFSRLLAFIFLDYELKVINVKRIVIIDQKERRVEIICLNAPQYVQKLKLENLM